MAIHIDNLYPWRRADHGSAEVCFAGHEPAAKAVLASIWDERGQIDMGRAKDALNAATGCFSLIVRVGGAFFACVDRIRSYPIAYSEARGFDIGNSARRLREVLRLDKIDEVARLEFAMMGYVTDRDTLYAGLKQLQAGECLSYDTERGGLKTDRYWTFYPSHFSDESDDIAIERLDHVVNNCFKRVIEKAAGASIWISLSGGLDSRVIACKLRELGYDNLNAYTYGPPGTDEAKFAETVAKKLKINWVFAANTRQNAKRLFDSQTRRRYWDYADFLSAVPVMADFQTLYELIGAGKIKECSVIINGHSGDFTTGGRIYPPERYASFDFEGIFCRIRDKHLQLWKNQLNPANVAKIRDKVRRSLGLAPKTNLGYEKTSAFYEMWEWQERQSKYVIGAQRKYEFFGLKWQLPLWEKEYAEFWANFAPERKINQRLYVKWLEKRDFFGLFKNFKSSLWNWPGLSITVPVMAQPIRLVFGRKYSDMFYRYCDFWGRYRNDYYPYGRRFFLSVAPQTRNPVSFHANRWLEENLAISLSRGS